MGGMALHCFFESLGAHEDGGEVGQPKQIQVLGKRSGVEDGLGREAEAIAATPRARRRLVWREAIGVQQASRLDLQLEELGRVLVTEA